MGDHERVTANNNKTSVNASTTCLLPLGFGLFIEPEAMQRSQVYKIIA
jgi:hypothetical protein